MSIYIHDQQCSKFKTWIKTAEQHRSGHALIQLYRHQRLRTEQGKLYNCSKSVILGDPQGKVLEKHKAELSGSEVVTLYRQVLAQAPFSISTTTPSQTALKTANASLESTRDSVKAVLPGFEAILSIASTVVAVALAARRFK